MTITFMTSKWGIKKLFVVFEVDKSWYNVLVDIYSIIKVLLTAGVIIFIAFRIFLHDVTVKSFDNSVGTQTEQYNQKQLDDHKTSDPNTIEQLTKDMKEKREMELNDKIREKNQKARDEFQKYLDTLY